jgi:pimeloyl-ACP methyl ester carboxylesterase
MRRAGVVLFAGWCCGCGGVGVGNDGASSESSSTSTSDAPPPSPTTSTTTSATTAMSASASATSGADTTDTGGSTQGDATETTGEPFPEPVPDDCITDVTPGHHEYTCDGLVYDVEVPEVCLREACGMIFDVHGLAMSAQMQNACTNLRTIAPRYGFIVVQPNADPAPPASNWIPAIDDDKVFDFMQRTAAAFHVDADRWHMTGFSQGGFMTWRFACAHADVLASVAPAAACGNDFPITDCQFTEDESPSEPISILYMHGTADFVVNHACAVPRRDAVLERFALGDEEVVLDDPEVRHHRWTGDDMTFEYVEHDYTGDAVIAGGHCMPGADDPGDAPGQLVVASCDDPFLFVWGEEVVQFFLAHPRG